MRLSSSTCWWILLSEPLNRLLVSWNLGFCYSSRWSLKCLSLFNDLSCTLESRIRSLLILDSPYSRRDSVFGLTLLILNQRLARLDLSDLCLLKVVHISFKAKNTFYIGFPSSLNPKSLKLLLLSHLPLLLFLLPLFSFHPLKFSQLTFPLLSKLSLFFLLLFCQDLLDPSSFLCLSFCLLLSLLLLYLSLFG